MESFFSSPLFLFVNFKNIFYICFLNCVLCVIDVWKIEKSPEKSSSDSCKKVIPSRFELLS